MGTTWAQQYDKGVVLITIRGYTSSIGVVGKSIQYGMTLSHSKDDSTSATIKAKLFELTSL